MKKLLFGLFALVFALGAVAFTRDPKSPKSGSYWFQLDPNTGTQMTQGSIPTSSATDPNVCPLGTSKYCSRQYSEYEQVPGSSPALYRGVAGTEEVTHKKSN